MENSLSQIPDGYKQCKKCNRVLPATDEYFAKDRKKKDGRYYICKECKKSIDLDQPPPVDPLPGTMKICAKCKQSLPATKEYFFKCNSRKDGLYSWCKICDRNIKKVTPSEGSMKICGKCKRSFPATKEYFFLDKNRFDGLYPTCKECLHSQRFEPVIDENVMRVCTRCHKEYPSTPQYFRVTRDKKSGFSSHCVFCLQEYMTKRYERNPIRVHELNKGRQHRRRARKRSIAGEHTPEQIIEQLKRQKYRCYYAACGHAKFKRLKGKYIYHIEHTFPVSRVVGGDIPANDMSYIVLACPKCNQSKGDKFPWEWNEGGRLL